ncbi:MAG TPA: tetratricopeptide repeat protein [Phycisphaerae bacterium]|nr:tetratricopeptide repeat protein [Phycisphaerae bacterium]
MPATAKRQLWLIVILFILAAVAVYFAYLRLRASNIQMAQGRQAYDAGKYALAEDAYLRSVTVDQNNAEAWYWLGISRKNQGKVASAAEALIKATQLEPNNANWWFESAQALQWAERFSEAEQAWAKVQNLFLPDDPRVVQARINQAQCLAHHGDVERAIEMMKAMLATKDDPNIRCELAKVLGYAGRYEESVQEFRRAFGETPTNQPEK